MNRDQRKNDGVLVRDAAATDIPQLAAMCYGAAVHRERVAAADGQLLRYLVVEHSGDIAGFGCLVMGQPESWPPMKHVPQLFDIFIRPTGRGQGLGSALARAMEGMAGQAGFGSMFLGLDPQKDGQAEGFCRRRGYTPVDGRIVEDHWEYVDSHGVHHAGVERLVYMRKALAGWCP